MTNEYANRRLVICSWCEGSGVTLRRYRKDLLKDFYCDVCKKYAVHERYTPEQLAVALGINPGPIPHDNLGEIKRVTAKIYHNDIKNWPYAVMKAIIQVRDIRNISMDQIRSLVGNEFLPQFQKFLLEFSHGENYDRELEDQTLIESFLFFATKVGLITKSNSDQMIKK